MSIRRFVNETWAIREYFQGNAMLMIREVLSLRGMGDSSRVKLVRHQDKRYNVLISEPPCGVSTHRGRLPS